MFNHSVKRKRRSSEYGMLIVIYAIMSFRGCLLIVTSCSCQVLHLVGTCRVLQ